MNTQSFQYEWLIIALIYNHKHYDEIYSNTPGYQTMDIQINHLFKDIEDSVYHPKVKIVLLENKLSYIRENDLITGIDETIEVMEKTANATLEAVEGVGLQLTESMTDPNSLIKLLSYLRAQHSARRSMILTYGHGSIFGINYITIPENVRRELKKQFAPVQETVKHSANAKAWLHKQYFYKPSDADVANKLLHKMRSAVHSFEAGGIAQENVKALEKVAMKFNQTVVLTNREMSEVVGTVWGQKKLDLLVMYNCLMQNVYTQYELKDCVDFLVAPVSGICLPGYNYSGVLDSLGKNLSASNGQVAGWFVSNIRDGKYYAAGKEDIECTWKLCSVQLDPVLFEEIRVLFTNWISEALNLYKQSPKVFTCINHSIVQCLNYAKNCLNNDESVIDMLSFLRHLSFKIEDGFPSLSSLKVTSEALIAKLENVKSLSFLGKKFFPSDHFIDETFPTHYGFGIVMQRKLYAEQSIQCKTLLEVTKEYSPSFLDKSGFYKFYKLYAKFNGASDTSHATA